MGSLIVDAVGLNFVNVSGTVSTSVSKLRMFSFGRHCFGSARKARGLWCGRGEGTCRAYGFKGQERRVLVSKGLGFRSL